MEEKSKQHLQELIEWFRPWRNAFVAFSGGVDSGLLVAVAKIALGSNAYAVTAKSPSLPDYELKEARDFAESIKVKHIVIDTEEFNDEDYLRNMPDRCFFCKDELGSKLKRLAEELGIEVIVDGTNADDVKGHRPGFKALRKHGIRSPLLELGIGKEEVKRIANNLRLKIADKPPSACLSSRIEYGQRITIENLKRVSEAEKIVRELTNSRVVRVRVHGSIARIEVGRDERKKFFNEGIMDKVHRELLGLGFTYITLDLYGYSSGSMLKSIYNSWGKEFHSYIEINKQ